MQSFKANRDYKVNKIFPNENAGYIDNIMHMFLSINGSRLYDLFYECLSSAKIN